MCVLNIFYLCNPYQDHLKNKQSIIQYFITKQNPGNIPAQCIEVNPLIRSLLKMPNKYRPIKNILSKISFLAIKIL